VLTLKHEQKQAYVPSGVITTAQIFLVCLIRKLAVAVGRIWSRARKAENR